MELDGQVSFKIPEGYAEGNYKLSNFSLSDNAPIINSSSNYTTAENKSFLEDNLISFDII